MRNLIVQQWVTVDNIAAEEDGGLSFVSGEPFTEKTNPAFKASVMGFIDSVDTMILGANTYAQSKDYWPYADEQGEYGEKLNNLTKFVVSSKLDDAPWGDFPAATVTRDPVSTILGLKEQSGKAIWLWGSLKLMHSLMEAGCRRRSPDAALPGVTRQGNARFRGLAGPEAGRGHLVRERRGTSALRDQEVGGKSALPLPATGRPMHPRRSAGRRHAAPAVPGATSPPPSAHRDGLTWGGVRMSSWGWSGLR